MPILQKYMMGSSAALLTCFLTAALLIAIIASVRRYLDARAVRKGLALPSGASSWFTYTYGVVALLHLIVALTLTGDNQDMFVTVFWTGLAIPMMVLVLYHVIQGIGNDSAPQDAPSESDLISQYKATYFDTLLLTAICTIFATIFSVVGSTVYESKTVVTEVVDGRVVEYRGEIELTSNGVAVTIAPVTSEYEEYDYVSKNHQRREATSTVATWLERDSSGSIKTVSIDTGGRGGLNIADDLPAGEAPYVTYTPQYSLDSYSKPGDALCVMNRDTGCLLNARHVYDSVTIHNGEHESLTTIAPLDTNAPLTRKFLH